MYFEIYNFSYENAYSCTNFYNFSGKGLTSSVSVNLEILAFYQCLRLDLVLICADFSILRILALTLISHSGHSRSRRNVSIG